ncbi:FG-GAP repeat domain-containing protein [Kocuria sabuli]|uniref:FG-GAP repeat domain-containing protein n=1 Tax=Kocuria sabuli TaxID=3071448 RepID=UPI0034D56B8E
MKPFLLSRLATGASAALLAVTGLALGGAPAHARTYHGPYVQPMFSYADGWRVDQHVRELADVNGDGRLDVVGFGNAGVYVSYAQPDGSFTPATVKLRQFGWDQGRRVDQHPREVVDLVGNGTADIVGFGYSGVTVTHGQTDRTFIGAGKRIDSYGYNRGWRVDQHPRTLADVDGDGAADIVGFGDAGAWVSYFSVAGDTFTTPQLLVRDFGSQQGWRVGDHPVNWATSTVTAGPTSSASGTRTPTWPSCPDLSATRCPAGPQDRWGTVLPRPEAFPGTARRDVVSAPKGWGPCGARRALTSVG